ncbi:MAG: pyridoxamine 5'-phosphate oxidase family protein [Coriobacteriia bacterium]|nr:pyridoxamine 5'-phosphate oxidase family protein [Coriobacteriia bacterium]
MVDYEKAATYWTDQECTTNRMPAQELCVEIRRFVDAHQVGCLATSLPDGFVRNTPIQYECFQGAFWMFSEGGLKFRGLAENLNVGFAVFDQDPSFDALAGLQVMGLASVVEPWSMTYMRALKHRGLDPEEVKALPITLNLICVRPVRMDYLCSDLKKQGYSVRQWLEGDDLAPFGLL